jgi:RNA-directed DNA polymerase
MKSYNNLYSEFISFKNIYNAYKKARKSKPNKKSVLDFQLNLEKELFSIQEDLIKDNYHFAPYKRFKIYQPKERVISAPVFRDVVVQHAIINIIEPLFEKTFINNSFACRKEKGTHKGLLEIKKVIQSKNSPKYYLKQDIKKYFPSIHKPTLKKIISKRIKDKKLLSIIFKIIDSYSFSEKKKEKGIPIGNLTSQLFANIYLNELDQYIKHTLKIKHYYRYVDDFLIFSENKKDLRSFKRKINLFLNKNLYLNIPNNKKYINLIKEGVDFVGYKVFPKRILLRKSNIKRFLKRTKKNLSLLKDNKLSLIKFKSSLFSFISYIKFSDSISSFINYFFSIENIIHLMFKRKISLYLFPIIY